MTRLSAKQLPKAAVAQMDTMRRIAEVCAFSTSTILSDLRSPPLDTAVSESTAVCTMSVREFQQLITAVHHRFAPKTFLLKKCFLQYFACVNVCCYLAYTCSYIPLDTPRKGAAKAFPCAYIGNATNANARRFFRTRKRDVAGLLFSEVCTQTMHKHMTCMMHPNEPSYGKRGYDSAQKLCTAHTRT